MTRKEFQSTVVPHHHAMFRMARTLCGNPDDASDLVQETLLRLWNRRKSIVITGNSALIASPP